MSILGSLVGAGSSLIGGLLGNSQEKEALQWQKTYAKHRVEMTVKDAERAGIHPLAALGSSAAGSMVSPPYTGNSLGDGVARAGQILADQLSTGRATRELMSSEAERNRAETAMLNDATSRSQIAKARAGAIDAPAAVAGAQPKRPAKIVAGPGHDTVVMHPAIPGGKVNLGNVPNADQLQEHLGELGDFLSGWHALNQWADNETSVGRFSRDNNLRAIASRIKEWARSRAQIDPEPTRAIDARKYLERN